MNNIRTCHNCFNKFHIENGKLFDYKFYCWLCYLKTYSKSKLIEIKNENKNNVL